MDEFRIPNSKKFEIPYNFDPHLIEILKYLPLYHENIYCIYCPPYYEDYMTVIRTQSQASKMMKYNRKDYEEQMTTINSIFPNKLQLILQKEEPILTEDQIRYYQELGFTKFCVYNDKMAEKIKNLSPESEIVGSIVKKVQLSDLIEHPEYHELYEGFVLDFSYNKDIEKIKAMPREYKYMLLANGFCATYCDGISHWWKDILGEDYFICPMKTHKLPWESTILIRPQDLEVFDPYISVWKLQDRSWFTERIIQDFMLYAKHSYAQYIDMKPEEKFYTKGFSQQKYEART